MDKVKTGKLYLNANERLALDEWTEFHCGDVVEVFVSGEWEQWRIEMNGRGEWYLCKQGYNGGTLTWYDVVGLTVREVR